MDIKDISFRPKNEKQRYANGQSIHTIKILRHNDEGMLMELYSDEYR